LNYYKDPMCRLNQSLPVQSNLTFLELNMATKKRPHLNRSRDETNVDASSPWLHWFIHVHWINTKTRRTCATGELNTYSALFSFSPIPSHPVPWTWKDGLYKVKDYLTHTTHVLPDRCSWPMRHCHFPGLALLEGMLTCGLFPVSQSLCAACHPQTSTLQGGILRLPLSMF
jgi:hypothetical protein